MKDKILKITLLWMWAFLWIIAVIDNFKGKDISVFYGTLLLTLLFLAYNVHKGLDD